MPKCAKTPPGSEPLAGNEACLKLGAQKVHLASPTVAGRQLQWNTCRTQAECAPSIEFRWALQSRVIAISNGCDITPFISARTAQRMRQPAGVASLMPHVAAGTAAAASGAAMAESPYSLGQRCLAEVRSLPVACLDGMGGLLCRREPLLRRGGGGERRHSGVVPCATWGLESLRVSAHPLPSSSLTHTLATVHATQFIGMIFVIAVGGEQGIGVHSNVLRTMFLVVLAGVACELSPLFSAVSGQAGSNVAGYGMRAFSAAWPAQHVAAHRRCNTAL